MNSTTVFICHKCDQHFSSKKRLKNHFGNTIPCDFTEIQCPICNVNICSTRTYRRHVKKCKANTSATSSTSENLKATSTTNATNETPISINKTNETSANSIKTNNNINSLENVANSNTNTTNTSTNTQINNDIKNNNIVMLHPLGLTHHYMNREEIVNPVKGTLLELIREQKYELAYRELFKQIHGNPKIPEHHNIYVDKQGTDQACVFNGKYFQMESLDEIIDSMYRVLKGEMKWAVNTSDIDEKEKDQLMWNIQFNWMQTDIANDKVMERILYNNKPVVEDTFRRYDVYSNLDYIARCNKCDVKDIIWDNSVPLKLLS